MVLIFVTIIYGDHACDIQSLEYSYVLCLRYEHGESLYRFYNTIDRDFQRLKSASMQASVVKGTCTFIVKRRM